ncbi:MAG: periplasmic serine proteases (ClpP class) [halophilic archaeon J07HB67]|jgi:Periplasmic serine proteases (ClpP class)|nr:MAG: periplasmic serine proteases (ClpP class) [halophilic archaeon J07HB67]
MVLSYDGGISDAQVDRAVESLREARTNDSIEGVVIEMNSPGGAVTASERLYKAVQHTSEELPVAVAVKSVAASGGYYGSIAADRIFTQPSATVGSVGVFVPSGIEFPDSIVRSSPDKAEERDETVRRNVEQLQGTFVSSVMRERGPDSDHRGTTLQVEQSEVEMAHTYIGSRAVQNGFADELGGTRDAVVWVADQANLDSYKISRVETSVPSGIFLLQSDDTTKVVVKDGTTLHTMQSQYYALSLEHVPTVVASEYDGAGSATTDNTDAQSNNESLPAYDEGVVLGGVNT